MSGEIDFDWREMDGGRSDEGLPAAGSSLGGGGSGRPRPGADNFGVGAGPSASPSGSRSRGSVPHHQVPNFAAILPDYTNVEQDYIRQAFSKCSFVMVRDLPTRFQPSATARKMAEKMNVNRLSVTNVGPSAARKPVAGPASNGMFSTFDYIPSRFSLADELKTKARLESEAKMLDVGGRDFVPSGASRKQKYEDIFENPEYRFPYMGDAYEAAHDQELRAKWIENAKILHGPFIPTNRKAPLGKATRKLLPDLIRELHQAIAVDWGDHQFEVMATEDDHVAVRFLALDVRSKRGLAAYMNVMADTHHVVAKYKLTKVIEDWNSEPGDTYLYYLFRPPWVRTRATDVFFSLFPEKRKVAGSGSTPR